MISAHIPLATYRLQFNKNFTFNDATKILDYLRELGITRHIRFANSYQPPRQRARLRRYQSQSPGPGSGTEKDFDVLLNELEKRGMGLLLDIVPNHMAASSENPWWMDVLENGPDSAFSSYFDIDWHPPSRSLDNKILLPISGAALWRGPGQRRIQTRLRPWRNFTLTILILRFRWRRGPIARF